MGNGLSLYKAGQPGLLQRLGSLVMPSTQKDLDYFVH